VDVVEHAMLNHTMAAADAHFESSCDMLMWHLFPTPTKLPVTATGCDPQANCLGA
jgi:hypothetical protein